MGNCLVACRRIRKFIIEENPIQDLANSFDDARYRFEVYLSNRTHCSEGEELLKMLSKRDSRVSKRNRFCDDLLNISRDIYAPITKPDIRYQSWLPARRSAEDDFDDFDDHDDDEYL
jgi:hypothetical protein